MGYPQGLVAFTPPPPSLSACLAVPPHHTSTQTIKTPFAASERVPACPSIPTSGEDSLPHCYALIACQVPFLFCSLVCLFSPPFIFSLCLFHGSFLCWQHPLCLFTLLSRPGSLSGPFLCFLVPFNLVHFHELYHRCFSAAACRSTQMKTHSQEQPLLTWFLWSLLFLFACACVSHRERAVRNV